VSADTPQYLREFLDQLDTDDLYVLAGAVARRLNAIDQCGRAPVWMRKSPWQRRALAVGFVVFLPVPLLLDSLARAAWEGLGMAWETWLSYWRGALQLLGLLWKGPRELR
jgi:hypothetical protein